MFRSFREQKFRSLAAQFLKEPDVSKWEPIVIDELGVEVKILRCRFDPEIDQRVHLDLRIRQLQPTDAITISLPALEE